VDALRLAGVVLVPLVLAGLVWLLIRWTERRDMREAIEEARFLMAPHYANKPRPPKPNDDHN
jgi:hypothetical protein